MHETRLNSDGSFADYVDVAQHVEHLSMISQPHFQKELFCLTLCNLQVKQKMLRTAGWRSRNNLDARAIAEDITAEDISAAVESRRLGNTSSSARGDAFLKTVDAVTSSAPHTNDAAKRARRHGETMQHTFGPPHFFLTVTPDDDNSFIVKMMTPVSSLTDEELAR